MLGQRFVKLRCYLCKKPEGACIQCEDCYKAYHAMCAQKHNCYVTWRKGEDGSLVRFLADAPCTEFMGVLSVCRQSRTLLPLFVGFALLSLSWQKPFTYCEQHHPPDVRFDAEQRRWVTVDVLSLLPPAFRPFLNLRKDLVAARFVSPTAYMNHSCTPTIPHTPIL